MLNRSRTAYGGPDRHQEIYFIQAEKLGLIKIGTSDDAEHRLAGMQCGSPDRLKLLGIVVCKNRGRLEDDLHCQFHDHRVHGEWFEPAPELMAYIQANARRPSDVHFEMLEEWGRPRYGPDQPSYAETHPRKPLAAKTKARRAEPEAIRSTVTGRRAVLAAYKAARGLA